MVQGGAFQELDTQLEGALINLKLAGEAEHKAKQRLAEANIQADRLMSSIVIARKKLRDVESERDNGQQLLEEARRRAQEARRHNLPQQRWLSDTRRWEGEVRRFSMDVVRWDEDQRRKSSDFRALDEEIRELTDEIKRLEEATSTATRTLAAVRQRVGSGGRPQEATRVESTALTITQRATAALKDVLDKMDHQSDQLLRLDADAQGNLRLALDTQKQRDLVVVHMDAPVLLVESPIPDGLQGATLDTNKKPGGPTRLVLSRRNSASAT